MSTKTVRSTVPASQDDSTEPEHRAMTPHQAAGHVATAARMRDPQKEEVARRNLAEAKIADAIDKALAVAPPLTARQVQRLTGLLRHGGQK